MTASIVRFEADARLRVLQALLTAPEAGADELGGMLGENRGHRGNLLVKVSRAVPKAAKPPRVSQGGFATAKDGRAA
jgi:hypothetical protein